MDPLENSDLEDFAGPLENQLLEDFLFFPLRSAFWRNLQATASAADPSST